MGTLRTALACAVIASAAVATPAEPNRRALLSPGGLTEPGPDTFKVKFETTRGNFYVLVERSWAPQGADRFYHLVRNGYYDDTRFFRVMPKILVQFGIHGDPAVNSRWKNNTIPDEDLEAEDIEIQSNRPGTIAFAASGPDSRTTQVFINYANNSRLDKLGFVPFGRVVVGMDVVEQINDEYGGRPGMQQPRIQSEGNAYLDRAFPRLDAILSASLVE